MKEINLLNNPNIFTEGETEKNLISTLFLGRVRIVNLWNTNEKALTPLFTVLDKKSVIIMHVILMLLRTLIKKDSFQT